MLRNYSHDGEGHEHGGDESWRVAAVHVRRVTAGSERDSSFSSLRGGVVVTGLLLGRSTYMPSIKFMATILNLRQR